MHRRNDDMKHGRQAFRKFERRVDGAYSQSFAKCGIYVAYELISYNRVLVLYNSLLMNTLDWVSPRTPFHRTPMLLGLVIYVFASEVLLHTLVSCDLLLSSHRESCLKELDGNFLDGV